jgi:hypothetical protein
MEAILLCLLLKTHTFHILAQYRFYFNSIYYPLTLILLTWRIWWVPNNASRWQMEFNLAFKGLILILLTWRIWWAPNNACKSQMEFNLAFKGLTLILLTWRIWWAPNNASRWQMGFSVAFKGLMHATCFGLYLGYPQACQHKHHTKKIDKIQRRKIFLLHLSL